MVLRKRLGKCAICKTEFQKFSMAHKLCPNPECLDKFLEAQTLKRAKSQDAEQKRLDRKRKQELKSLAELKREAQTAFNAWIRWRDRAQPCISCEKGPEWAGQWHAGHYLSRGSHPELSFSELNVHKQCSQDNHYNPAGTARRYREKLIERIGLDQVELLEGPQEAKHYTRQDLINIKKEYTDRLRAEKKATEE